MRTLITGAAGFAGRHLLHTLLSSTQPVELYGTAYINEDIGTAADLPVEWIRIDLRDTVAVNDLIQQVQPEEIYHLAAMSSASQSLRMPWPTLETNIHMQLNLLEACRQADITPRILIISSADIYGPVTPDELPITEEAPFRPTNPYSVSKIAQDMMGLQYYLAYNQPIIRIRAFNHLGPGQQTSFVAPDFAMQIAKIEQGEQAPVISVGNLGAGRDFTDVRDVVRAYAALMRHGKAGTAYNVASNRATRIQDMLDTLLSLTDADITVQIDPDKFRPVDVAEVRGDFSRLQLDTSWTPQIPLEQTLRDLLDDCRQRVRATQ